MTIELEQKLQKRLDEAIQNRDAQQVRENFGGKGTMVRNVHVETDEN